MRYLSLLLFLLLALPALGADVAPTARRAGPDCYEYTLCSSQAVQTGGTPCDSSTGDIVLYAAGRSNLTFYSTQSTASSYSCDVYSADESWAASSGGHKVNSTSLTQTTPVLSINGMFDYLWVECTSIANNQVTVNLLACAAGR